MIEVLYENGKIKLRGNNNDTIEFYKDGQIIRTAILSVAVFASYVEKFDYFSANIIRLISVGTMRVLGFI